MSGKSVYLQNAALNHNMGKAAFTMPAAVWAALCTVTVTESMTGSTITEATYTGYARVQVPAASLNAAAGGSMTNSADIVWPDVTAGTNNIVSVAFCDAATAGNMLYFDSNVGTVEVSIVQTPPTVKAGALTLTES